jgi:NADH-quinone oxidoreductase subunit M
MVNHGIITGALFLAVGMIYERTHTREIAAYGGLFKAAPIYTTFLAFFCLAAIGFPGLNAFIGEFLIISGAFSRWTVLGVMAVWGVVLGTIYVVWLYYRMALGEVKPALEGRSLDLGLREVATLLPLVAMAVLIGLYPESVLGYVREPVARLLETVTTSPIQLVEAP